jgi:TolA-binding protein
MARGKTKIEEIPGLIDLFRQRDELLRRIERLEEKQEILQKQNNAMYKVLKSKHSFLDFEFIEEDKIDEQRGSVGPFYDIDDPVAQAFRQNLSRTSRFF